jgi:hypothetical protein
LDYLSGAMLIEDVRHHYGHHHNDEGPDLATGALLVSIPVPVVRELLGGQVQPLGGRQVVTGR